MLPAMHKTHLLLIAYLAVVGFGYWLKYLNLSHLKTHGGTVPPEFRGSIDPEVLKKISLYTFENSRAGFVESAVNSILLIILLFGGLLGWYDQRIGSVTSSFILTGVLFALVLTLAEQVVDIPFSLYRHFTIENRYGFNTMSFRLWLGDLAKSISLAIVLGGIVIAAALWIVTASPGWWWLWLWLFLLAFGIFMMYVSPYIIEPLFFKFEPIRAEGLEERIRSLMTQAGLRVSRVFQVDASRRSRHSNAYFTGIGKVKRIVLFDTLIAQMSQEEILSVLAHEVGHWKKRHVLKRIVLSQASAFAGLFVAYHLLRWNGLPGLLGLQQASFFARVLIVAFLSSLVTFPFNPLFSYISRRDEREADRFAVDLARDPGAMASALVKLSRENLSNLHPHPLYAAFYYSPPPVVERVRELKKIEHSNERG